MKNYFYIRNNEKQGPFEKADLQSQNLDKDTLVWCEGMTDWTPLEQISELNELINKLPPPIPTVNLKPKPNLEKESKEIYYADLITSYFRYKVLIRTLVVSIPFGIIFLILQPYKPYGLFPVYLTDIELHNIDAVGIKFYLMGIPLYLTIGYLATIIKFRKSDINYDKLEDTKTMYLGVLAATIISVLIAAISIWNILY
ncbi:MAG: DUF4339 domain-containing protein [Bacteroidetes bacterium]|nr:DUF4339 domain-containing protein [Bacteroidota bacterium]